MITEAAIASSYEALHNVSYGAQVEGMEGMSLIKMSVGILNRVSRKIIPTDWSTTMLALICNNPKLRHFLGLHQRVCPLFSHGKFRDFTDLSREYTF